MLHWLKKFVDRLEKSSDSKSKVSLKFRGQFLSLGMIEKVWMWDDDSFGAIRKTNWRRIISIRTCIVGYVFIWQFKLKFRGQFLSLGVIEKAWLWDDDVLVLSGRQIDGGSFL